MNIKSTRNSSTLNYKIGLNQPKSQTPSYKNISPRNFMKWFCRLQSFEKIEILLWNGNDEIIRKSKIFWPHCAKVQSTRRRAIYLQKRFQFYLITNLGPFSVLLQYIYILASHISVNTQCGQQSVFEKFKRCFYISRT